MYHLLFAISEYQKLYIESLKERTSPNLFQCSRSLAKPRSNVNWVDPVEVLEVLHGIIHLLKYTSGSHSRYSVWINLSLLSPRGRLTLRQHEHRNQSTAESQSWHLSATLKMILSLFCDLGTTTDNRWDLSSFVSNGTFLLHLQLYTSWLIGTTDCPEKKGNGIELIFAFNFNRMLDSVEIVWHRSLILDYEEILFFVHTYHLTVTIAWCK